MQLLQATDGRASSASIEYQVIDDSDPATYTKSPSAGHDFQDAVASR